MTGLDGSPWEGIRMWQAASFAGEHGRMWVQQQGASEGRLGQAGPRMSEMSTSAKKIVAPMPGVGAKSSFAAGLQERRTCPFLGGVERYEREKGTAPSFTQLSAHCGSSAHLCL